MTPGKVKYGIIDMEWKEIKSKETIKGIEEKSRQNPVIIFKHSTRCPISSNVLGRLKRDWQEEQDLDAEFYIIDIINYRDLSKAIADHFNVKHQSPQMMIIKNGQSIYDESHFDIEYDKIKEKII